MWMSLKWISCPLMPSQKAYTVQPNKDKCVSIFGSWQPNKSISNPNWVFVNSKKWKIKVWNNVSNQPNLRDKNVFCNKGINMVCVRVESHWDLIDSNSLAFILFLGQNISLHSRTSSSSHHSAVHMGVKDNIFSSQDNNGFILDRKGRHLRQAWRKRSKWRWKSNIKQRKRAQVSSIQHFQCSLNAPPKVFL